MNAHGVSNLGPRYNHGPHRQPRHDSYGRKVPIWEALSLDVVTNEKKPVENQTSWKSWIKPQGLSSSSISGSSDFNYHSEKSAGPSSWKTFFATANTWKGSTSSASDPYPTSPHTRLPSNDTLHESYWKPYTLKLHVLGSIFVVSLGLIAALEVLYHVSNGKNNANGGGLAFAATANDLSTISQASYLYLPTVIAVIYSMVWSWVDLDVKRLEPWFQLSKPHGAIAEESLLLQYPFDFLAFVPVRAARRRHWAVVIAGFTMVFITWAIVPLQSAIFSTGTVFRGNAWPMTVTHALMPLTNQTLRMNSRFLSTAYGVSWLQQKLPIYTTKDYTLLPFRPINANTAAFATETWTSTTQMFYTNLTCSPASVSIGAASGTSFADGTSAVTWTFNDGDGCIVPDRQISSLDKFRNLFDYKLASMWNPNCTGPNNLAKFLAISSNTASEDGNQFANLNALFCHTKYYSRTVTATVNATTLAVVDVDYDRNTQGTEINGDVFNITNFEHMLSQGISPLQGSFPTGFGSVEETSEVEQYPRLIEHNVTWPADNMVGYAVALSLPVEPAGLHSAARLEKAFERAHKLLFATAINQLLVPVNDTDVDNLGLSVQPQSQGWIRDKPEAIVYVRSFAIVVEACLGVVAALTCALWLYYRRRVSNMVTDPGSISDVMQLVRTSLTLLHDFDDNGTITQEALERGLKGHNFRLRVYQENGSPKMQLQAEDTRRTPSISLGSRTKKEIDCPEQFQGVRPFELKYITGAMITSVVACAIATLIVLFVHASRHNGLRRPTNNENILLILTNLVPTAFATLIEPFWIVLNRLLCVLQPFTDLRRGNATSSSSIKARYTSVPPQLAFWRALRAKHFLLAVVCAVAMSTNVLAVALSALFSETPTVVLLGASSKSVFIPVLDGAPDFMQNAVGGIRIPYLDHFYAGMANLSGEAPLPPWINTEYWFMPFELPHSIEGNDTKTKIEITGYTGATRGFGVDVDCREISAEGEGDTLIFEPYPGYTHEKEDMQEWTFSINHDYPDGKNITCGQWKFGNKNGTEIFIDNYFPAKGALEIVGSMGLSNDTDGFNTGGRVGGFRMPPPDDGYCASLFVSGYVRLGSAVPNTTRGFNNTRKHRDFESAFMQCKPQLRTAMFDVDVDTEGRIVSSNRTTEFDTDMEKFGGQRPVEGLLEQVNQLVGLIVDGRYRRWHNDTASSDWFNAALAKKMNTTRLYDPSTPLPNITEIIPHSAATYRLLAAALLGFQSKSFVKQTEDQPMQLSIRTLEQRIGMDTVMFYIAAVLLGIQLVTLLAYYVLRPRRFLPRLPLTIASVISFVSASHATQQVHQNANDKKLRYAYGRFRGVDGKTHVGIEIAPLVVPLKADNADFKRRRSFWLNKKQDPSQPKIWI